MNQYVAEWVRKPACMYYAWAYAEFCIPQIERNLSYTFMQSVSHKAHSHHTLITYCVCITVMVLHSKYCADTDLAERWQSTENWAPQIVLDI